jgi:gamma-glutamyltranspeptidase/glutathione hydrolase
MRLRRWFFYAGLALLALATVRLPVLGQDRALPASDAVYERYAVAADHPLASEAGAEVLAAGGNAADAAAATMLALGVVSPASSGLGGGGFALYYRASDRSLHYLDFREQAPAAATAALFARREGDDDETAANRSRVGGLAVAVPGEPAGIDALIERFGSGAVTRRQIFAPAVRYASRGFEASRALEGYSRAVGAALREDPVLARWLPRGEAFIPEGRRLRNPEQARTLRELAARGSAALYRGRIGREIVRRVRAAGGILTLEDLAAYEVATREPLSATHFGHRWVSAPPPSAGGVTLLGSLALLERWLPEAERGRDSALFRHALAESWKGPYTDRNLYLGDPAHVDVPTAALVARERIDARAASFDPNATRPTARYDTPLAVPPTRPSIPGGDAGTSHLCVVDADGNIATVTTTVNLLFGARFTAAGIVMNDEMDDFAREVGQPNAFGLVGGAANLPGPGRRPISSMTPTIVFAGDEPILCVGGAGGSRIITAVEQVALFSVLFGDRPGQALARARVHHQGAPDALFVEAGMPPAMRGELAARGHDLREIESSAVVQAIRIERDGTRRRLFAASDPRKGGRPAGR